MTNPVDPWRLQASLMAKSGQEMPERPTLTLAALTYVALQLEELAELAAGVAEAMPQADQLRAVWGSMSDEERGSLLGISVALSTVQDAMNQSSLCIRRCVAELKDSQFQSWVLQRQDAVEILDGVTDLMVTAAGFSLAAGLPGPEGFFEVSRSNLSKANPLTGRIDKDSSGKWIKGVSYTPPDLLTVLDQQAQNNPEHHRV